MTEFQCCGCGGRASAAWRSEGQWTVVRCLGCGLRATWPRPLPGALEAAYAGDDYYEQRSMGDAAGDAWKARALELLALVPEPIGKVLDFGAGQGHLVAALRSLGHEADGVEPSPAGRAAASRLHGVTLLPEPGGAGYDLVTLVHSLEHVPDPLEALRALRRVLRAGGWLLVEVPHADSIEMRRPSRRRRILDLPFHLHHFTPEALGSLLARAEFEVAATHLANPEALEWVLGLRARILGRSRGRGPGAEPTRHREAAAAAVTGRSGEPWAGRALRRLRTRFPGWKFQMVGRRRE